MEIYAKRSSDSGEKSAVLKLPIRCLKYFNHVVQALQLIEAAQYSV